MWQYAANSGITLLTDASMLSRCRLLKALERSNLTTTESGPVLAKIAWWHVLPLRNRRGCPLQAVWEIGTTSDVGWRRRWRIWMLVIARCSRWLSVSSRQIFYGGRTTFLRKLRVLTPAGRFRQVGDSRAPS